MKPLTTLPLMLLAACGVSEPDFPQALAESRCEYLVGCYPGAWDSYESCVSEQRSPAPSGCTYQPAAAHDCLRALSELDCPTEGAAPDFPEACASVWTECAQ